MNYKGFQIIRVGDSYSIWGASHYEPVNTLYGWGFSNANDCKEYIIDLLKSWNEKNWKTN